MCNFVPVWQEIGVINAHVDRAIITFDQMEIVIEPHPEYLVIIIVQSSSPNMMMRELIALRRPFHRNDAGKRALADMIGQFDDCVLRPLEKNTLVYPGQSTKIVTTCFPCWAKTFVFRMLSLLPMPLRPLFSLRLVHQAPLNGMW